MEIKKIENIEQEVQALIKDNINTIDLKKEKK